MNLSAQDNIQAADVLTCCIVSCHSPAASPEEKRVKSHAGRVSVARLNAARSTLSEEQQRE